MAYTTSFVVAVCAVFASHLLVVQPPLRPGAEHMKLQNDSETALGKPNDQARRSLQNSSAEAEAEVRENATASYLDEIRLEMCLRREEPRLDWKGSNRTTPEWVYSSGSTNRTAAEVHRTFDRGTLGFDNRWITQKFFHGKSTIGTGQRNNLLDLTTSKRDGRRTRARLQLGDDQMTEKGTGLLSTLIDEYCLHVIIWAAAFTQFVAIVMPRYRLLIAFWRRLRNNIMNCTIMEDIVILDPFEFLHGDVHEKVNDKFAEEVDVEMTKNENFKWKKEWTEENLFWPSEVSSNTESTKADHEHRLDIKPMKLADANDTDGRKNDDKSTVADDIKTTQVPMSNNLDFEDGLKIDGSKKLDDLTDANREKIEPSLPTRTTSRLPNILITLLRKKKTKTEKPKRKPILSIFRRKAKRMLVGGEEEVTSDIEELLKDCDACPDFSKARLVFLDSAFVLQT